jgi:hypothetical protein
MRGRGPWFASLGPGLAQETEANMSDVDAVRAAQDQAQAAAQAQRDLYGQHPGAGVSSPDQDPEYRRVRDA